MPTSVHLSVVIPSYNEQENIKKGVLSQVLSYLKKQSYSWEIVLSDDGSTDGTVAALEKFAAQDPRIRVLANIHAGKAPTVSAGMLAAEGRWRLFTDFDQSTPLSEIEQFWRYTDEMHFDIVIGSREAIGARRDKEPFYRRIMGRGFNMIVQILTVPGILDTQCGFKLFSAKATKDLFPRLYVYGNQGARTDAFTGAFDVELLFLADQLGYTIREVPIHWKHNKTDRVSPIKDSLRMFWDTLRIRYASIRGKYKKS